MLEREDIAALEEDLVRMRRGCWLGLALMAELVVATGVGLIPAVFVMTITAAGAGLPDGPLPPGPVETSESLGVERTLFAATFVGVVILFALMNSAIYLLATALTAGARVAWVSFLARLRAGWIVILAITTFLGSWVIACFTLLFSGPEPSPLASALAPLAALGAFFGAVNAWGAEPDWRARGRWLGWGTTTLLAGAAAARHQLDAAVLLAMGFLAAIHFCDGSRPAPEPK